METILENKDFCKRCGGYCCKKCGCDYWPSDFSDLSINGLTNILAEGNISIVAALEFERLANDKLVIVPFLYLRARNVDKDIIDLISIKNTCSMLRDDGCFYSYKDRPSGGVNLIPGEDRTKCHPKESSMEHMKEWESYQKVLSRIVKRYCGVSVDVKIHEDIENLFYDYLMGETEKAAIEEKMDVENLILLLLEVCPEEFKKASMRCRRDQVVNVKR